MKAMVINFTNYFSQPAAKVIHRPILNSMPMVSSPLQSSRLSSSYNALYQKFLREFRSTPEAVGTVNLLVTDILGDRPIFTKVDGTPLGRNKLLEAKRFWRNNRMKSSLQGALFDTIITGDGYCWKGSLPNEKRLQIAKEFALAMGFKNKLSVKQRNELMIKASQDEDLRKVRKFDYVPSTTVNINSNALDVTGYTQRSNGLTAIFKPEEIIHIKWMDIDGKVNGFSPFEALSREIVLLWFVKHNMIAYMENGGSPGKLLTMEDTMPGSDTYNKFVEEMRSFKDVRNRHGFSIGTGKINIQDLESDIKDLEYKDLALYNTSVFALAYNIPVSRLPFLLGSAATKGDAGGMAEQGYWNMISEKQDMVEDLLNSQLFEDMGWTIHFNRKYKQDEIREAQTFSMNADTVMKVQSLLKAKNKSLSETYIAQMLNIPMEEINELTPEEQQSQLERTGLMNQNLLDNMSVNKEPDNRKKADTKRNSANANINKSAGV